LYNSLFDDLDTFEDDNRDDEVLVAACRISKEKLSKYYSRTDLSKIFACSTFLDPALKCDYW
jgi:hypothetical protein